MNSPLRRPGIIRVVCAAQQVNRKSPSFTEYIRDFDAETHRFEWINLGGVNVCRVSECPDIDGNATSFSYSDFANPLEVSFIAEDEQ